VCVTRATIAGVRNGSTIDAYTVVSCSADVNAYPPATYIWTNEIDGSRSTGQLFLLQPGTQYKLTCTASNNFERCYATDYVELKSMQHLN